MMSPSKTDIQNKLALARLPSLPNVLAKLISLCQSDNATLTELSALIEQEPAIAARIMNIANSSSYHHMGPQVKLEQCLIALGTDMVRMLIINESVFQNFNSLPGLNNLDLRAFWLHSLRTAIIARNTAKTTSQYNLDEAYLAGLLHDIGRLGLLSVIPAAYWEIFHLPDNSDTFSGENETQGFNHAEIGEWLVKRWGLSENLAEALSHHHDIPVDITASNKLIWIIHMANRMSYHQLQDNDIQEIASEYALSPEDVKKIMWDVNVKVRQAATYLDLDLTDIPVIPDPAIPDPPASIQQQVNKEIYSLVHASEIGRYFQNKETEEEIQDAAMKASGALFSLEKTILLWHNKDDKNFRILRENASQQKLLGIHIPVTLDSRITQCSTKKDIDFITDISEFHFTPEKNIAKLLGGDTWILLPLVSHSHFLGVIFATIQREKLEQLKEEKFLLDNFSQQFVLAWARLEDIQKTIQQKITLVEEKYKRMSSEVIHEINNPLSIIRNYLFVLNKKLTESNKEKEILGILGNEINRIAILIKELNNPNHTKNFHAEQTDLMNLVRDVAQLFRETGFMPEHTRIITQSAMASSDLPFVKAPENLLKQVFVNLVKNAIEAMPHGGEIIITHEGIKEDNNKFYYALSIKDTGKGIPEEVLKNLFSPTISTKGKDHQGLGLSIVYGLLNKIDALIGCESNENGTVFTILIPAYLPKNPQGNQDRKKELM